MFPPTRKNATYLSAQSQNEMIEKHIIQRGISEEVKEAGFHSISADEGTASNYEILSVCLRFVDQKCDIRIGVHWLG